MKATTINTIACTVPIDQSTDPKNRKAYTLNKRYVDNGQEIFATVENEDLHWKFDRVVDDTSILRDECRNLVDAVLGGYNAAYFSVSVSDGRRHNMEKQRNQTLKVIFKDLETALQHTKESFDIEYAFLGSMNDEYYDIRKKINRTNESMEARGLDAIMRSVDNVKSIYNLMVDRETAIPYLLSIKLTNKNTKAIGRFSIIDLLYSPFSPSIRDTTLNSIQDILSALTTPKYTGLMQLGSSFLAKEITKYICGHNELLMILYLNDRIINETHSRDTLFLVSLLSSFTGKPVRSFPNPILSNNPELKRLRSELKTLSRQREKLEKLHFHLISQLHERISTIEHLEKRCLELKSKLPEMKAQCGNENLDELLALRRKEIQYLETTLLSKSLIHDFDIQQYKIEIAKLNTMLDIKDFSEEDLSVLAKRMESNYEKPVLDLEHRLKPLKARVNELLEEEEKVKEEIHALENAKPEPIGPIKIGDSKLIKPIKIEETMEPEMPETAPEEIDLEDIKEEVEDGSLIVEIQTLEKKIASINKQIAEIKDDEDQMVDHCEQEKKKLLESVDKVKEEHKTNVANIKTKASERLKELAKKLEEIYASQSQQIENLKEKLRAEKEENHSNENGDLQSEVEAPQKKRKVASSDDDKEE